jgi:putative ABC transport system ATP-binding protein
VTPLLSLQGIGKAWGEGDQATTIFDDFALALAPGEVVALTGASGSGKSTLLNLIAGIVPADRGSIALSCDVLGPEVFRYGQKSSRATAPVRRRALGYVFQFFNLVPTLTVGENLALALQLAGQEARWQEAVARLAAMGLGDALARFPESLSGGEQQRVAIARALAARPPLLLADEPTGNLDSGNAAQVVDTLWRAVAETGAAMLIATHDPQVAARADRQIALG